jgi:hypothetical protein
MAYDYPAMSIANRQSAYEWATIFAGIVLFGFLSYWFTRPYILLFVLGLVPTGVSGAIALKKTASLRKAALTAVAVLVILDVIWLVVVSMILDQVLD